MIEDDEFDAEIAQAAISQRRQEQLHGAAVAARSVVRRASHIATRRAKSESILHSLLPWPIEPNHSIHVMSSGDVDFLSYIIFMAAHTPIEILLVSTWCMAMPDIDWLRQQIAIGRIGTIDFILGEIFPSQYPDEYLAVAEMQRCGQVSLVIAKNHAKVACGVDPDADFHFVIESSANLNSNPRIEQTAIHASRALHAHYTQFFAEVHSIDKATRTSNPSKP